MSLLGWINDKLTGNPSGTADAASEAAARADAYEQARNQQLIDAGLWTPEEIAASEANWQTNGPDPSSLGAFAEEVGAGVSTLPESVLNPIDTFSSGLQWEAGEAGAVVGEVAGAAANGVKAGVGNILTRIPWWVWPIAAVVAFFMFGGVELLPFLAARKRKK